MPDPQAIRHTSDILLGQLSELEELERTKRELEPGSRAQIRLSRRVETLARKILHVAGAQTDLVEAVAATGSPDEAPTREPHVILAEWRDAERALDAATPGSHAWDDATRDVERLRTEYRKAFSARERH